MYCPICKQNFEDVDICPCCTDDNGDPIKLIPSPNENEVSDDEINEAESEITDAEVEPAEIDEGQPLVETEVIEAEAAETEADADVNAGEQLSADLEVTDAENTENSEEQSPVAPEVTEAQTKEKSAQQPQEIDPDFLRGVQRRIHEEMGLEPEWMSHADYFSVAKADGTCEEGYRLAYEDMRKKFGRKLWIEIDYSGKVTRVITTK